MTGYVFVLAVGFAAGALSGIIGTGSSVILLPILVLQFGPQQAVPIMAIAGLMVNVAKMAAWWREIDWRACLAYAVPGAPAAMLGARTLLILPPRPVDIGLGLFFLAMIPARLWLRTHKVHISLWHLAVAGAAIGFLTGLVMSTGPLSVPAFTAYGLAKGAFLSTEAASSLILFVAKIATFRALGALPMPSILEGAIVGAALMAGSYAGKRLVERMTTRLFHYVLDAVLLCSGLSLLWAAAFP